MLLEQSPVRFDGIQLEGEIGPLLLQFLHSRKERRVAGTGVIG